MSGIIQQVSNGLDSGWVAIRLRGMYRVGISHDVRATATAKYRDTNPLLGNHSTRRVVDLTSPPHRINASTAASSLPSPHLSVHIVLARVYYIIPLSGLHRIDTRERTIASRASCDYHESLVIARQPAHSLDPEEADQRVGARARIVATRRGQFEPYSETAKPEVKGGKAQ
jgi:hypothetical protein